MADISITFSDGGEWRISVDDMAALDAVKRLTSLQYEAHKAEYARAAWLARHGTNGGAAPPGDTIPEQVRRSVIEEPPKPKAKAKAKPKPKRKRKRRDNAPRLTDEVVLAVYKCYLRIRVREDRRRNGRRAPWSERIDHRLAMQEAIRLTGVKRTTLYDIVIGNTYVSVTGATPVDRRAHNRVGLCYTNRNHATLELLPNGERERVFAKERQEEGPRRGGLNRYAGEVPEGTPDNER